MARIRAFVLIIILIIISFLLIRFVLEFSQASNSSIVFSALLFPTNAIALFFRSITLGSIEISSIFAIIFLIILGYLISKIITAIERDDLDTKLLEILEAFLRLFEFLIILRLILEFMGASADRSAFVAFEYFLTAWSGAILKPVNLVFGSLDISALIVLAIIILLDINTEIILRGIKVIRTGSAKGLDFATSSAQKISASIQKTAGTDNVVNPTTTTETKPGEIKPEEPKAELTSPPEMPIPKADVPPEAEPNKLTQVLEQQAQPASSIDQTQTATSQSAPVIPVVVETSDAQTVTKITPSAEGAELVIPVAVSVTPENKPQEVKITLPPKKKLKPKTKHKDDITAPEG